MEGKGAFILSLLLIFSRIGHDTLEILLIRVNEGIHCIHLLRETLERKKKKEKEEKNKQRENIEIGYRYRYRYTSMLTNKGSGFHINL